MKDFAIVCFSCDKNDEVWPTFKICLDKYWKGHPVTYLLTETLSTPIMKTINYNYSLNKWTTRIYKSLEVIKQNKILFICDDCFLDDYVNKEKLERCLEILDKNKNIAFINLELSFDKRDLNSEYIGFKKKAPNSSYRLSLLCGIWDRKKLMDILKVKECSPWELESMQNILDYDSYQVTGQKILSWFRDGPKQCGAKYAGKWAKELPAFLEKEKIVMDLTKKGFNEKE